MEKNKAVSASLSRDEKQMKQKDYITELKDQQIRAANGEESSIERVPANRAAKSSKKEYKEYTIPSTEADDFVHVRVTRLNQNEAMKRYDEDTRVIPIHAREFDRRVAEGAFATYDEAEVLHDPRKDAPETYTLKAGTGDKQVEIDAKGPTADKNIAKRENALKEREQALKAREEEIKQSSERIGTGLQDRHAEIEQKEKELADREAALKAREEALNRPAPVITPDVNKGSGENPAANQTKGADKKGEGK